MAGGELLQQQNQQHGQKNALNSTGERQVGLLLQQQKLRNDPFAGAPGNNNGPTSTRRSVTLSGELPSLREGQDPTKGNGNGQPQTKSRSNSRSGTQTVSGSLPNISYPVREGEPDCQYYLKTGKCSFGVACKFNHPPGHSGTSGRGKTRSGPFNSLQMISGDLPSVGRADGQQQQQQQQQQQGGLGQGPQSQGEETRTERTPSSSSDIILVNLPTTAGRDERQLELAELQRLTDRLSAELAQLRAHRIASCPPGIVQVNVGGRMYQVSYETLRRLPNSKLAQLKPNANEAYFFDRNPTYFEVVLDFHRDGTTYIPPGLDGHRVRAEAMYWNVLSDMFCGESEQATEQYKFHKVFPHMLNEKNPSVTFDVRENEELEIGGLSGQGRLAMSSQTSTPCGGQLAATDVVMYDSETALAPGQVNDCRCRPGPQISTSTLVHQTAPEGSSNGTTAPRGLGVEFRIIYSFTGEDTFKG